jgi:hypothetical protein
MNKNENDKALFFVYLSDNMPEATCCRGLLQARKSAHFFFDGFVMTQHTLRKRMINFRKEVDKINKEQYLEEDDKAFVSVSHLKGGVLETRETKCYMDVTSNDEYDNRSVSFSINIRHIKELVYIDVTVHDREPPRLTY